MPSQEVLKLYESLRANDAQIHPATNRQMFAQLAGQAMAASLDWHLVYPDLALTPAVLLGGPVTLGYEE